MLFRPIPRSFIPPITSFLKRLAMSSSVPVNPSILDDAQYWHRHISPKAPAYWVFTEPIQKSQQDDRDYRLIRLDNGLQVMLVHDAKADKAAASLDVAVGHLHDPVSTSFLFPIMSIAYTWHFNRLTCQVLRISASICYLWCSTFQREKHINLTNYILQQGTEQFPKENEYSEVHHFTDPRVYLTAFTVPFQKQRFIRCIYGTFKYQFLFRCRNTCLNWRS